MSEADVQAVREVLMKFQDGYIHRDSGVLSDFAKLFVPGPELEIIGTGAVTPGDGEWCMGPDASLEMIKNDWADWGDFRLDVDNAHIHVCGSAAWLAATGTVRMNMVRDEVYGNYLKSIQHVIDNQGADPRARLLEIMRGGTNTLFEGERGNEYTWPIRFSAVLVNREEGWLFHQMQFSFATTRFPDVRKI